MIVWEDGIEYFGFGKHRASSIQSTNYLNSPCFSFCFRIPWVNYILLSLSLIAKLYGDGVIQNRVWKSREPYSQMQFVLFEFFLGFSQLPKELKYQNCVSLRGTTKLMKSVKLVERRAAVKLDLNDNFKKCDRAFFFYLFNVEYFKQNANQRCKQRK